MQEEADRGFDGQHYLPWTLRTTPRDPVPDKNQLGPEWAVKCQDQDAPIWNLKTPSGLPFGLVSSCMQGAIRQGRILESIQWSLECLATDAHLDGYSGQDEATRIIVTRKVGKGEVNVFHRQVVISTEDIGLANPQVVVTMAQLLKTKPKYATYHEAQRAFINTTIMLARSSKSRATDWAAIVRIDVPEPFETVLYYNKLIESLLAGHHVNAIGYAEGFIVASLKDKEAKVKEPLSKVMFGQLAAGATVRGEPLKFFKNKRQVLWTAIMRVVSYLNSSEGIAANQGKRYPVVTQVVESCYDLAHDDVFRWGIPARLFGRMAILTLCLKDAVEARGLESRNIPMEEFPNGREFTYDEIQQLRLSHRQGNLWYGIPQACHDKHTKSGAQMKRGIQHFVEVKSFLRHEDPALIGLSDYYLKLCFQTRYNVPGETFDRSGMSAMQYLEWLPVLRKRHDDLNAIENAILKSTMTITFGNQGESHVGMQIIGSPIDHGFTCAELMQIGNNFMAAGFGCELYNLQDGVKKIGLEVEEASILIIRQAASRFIDVSVTDKFQGDDRLLLEMLGFKWDDKMFSAKHKKVAPDGTIIKDGVVSKNARHNVCFSDVHQEADFRNKKGTIIAWNEVPLLKSLRNKLDTCFGPKAKNLVGEGNYYYDVTKCGLGYHGDFERKIVIAVRLGASMPLHYQWYKNSTPIGDNMMFMLNHGDVYIMSEKAVGHDYKRPSIPTLRHAAGCSKYTK